MGVRALMNASNCDSLHSFETIDTEYLFDDTTGALERVTDTDAEYDDEGIPSGTVTLEDVGTSGSRDVAAAELDRDLHNEDVHAIPKRLINDAEAILLDLASFYVGQNESDLGYSHPFAPVDSIDTVRELAVVDVAHSAGIGGN